MTEHYRRPRMRCGKGAVMDSPGWTAQDDVTFDHEGRGGVRMNVNRRVHCTPYLD